MVKGGLSVQRPLVSGKFLESIGGSRFEPLLLPKPEGNGHPPKHHDFHLQVLRLFPKPPPISLVRKE